MLLTEHNLTFYQQLMAGMRDAITARQFAQFAAQFRRDYLRT
jgi:queuine tRNA-ribosyltransferase